MGELMNFMVLERPQCVIVREDIGFVHTVVIHIHTVEVYTDFIGGADCRISQDGVEYEKYRHFSTFERFHEAMPGTAGAIRCNHEFVPSPQHDEMGMVTGICKKCGGWGVISDKRKFDKTLCPHCCSLTTFELGNGVYSCVECGFKVREEDFIPLQVR